MAAFSIAVSTLLATKRYSGMPPARAPPFVIMRLPEHHVGFAGDDRLDEVWQQHRVVLAVGVQHHHHLGAEAQRLEVTRLLIPAVAHVVRESDRADR